MHSRSDSRKYSGSEKESCNRQSHLGNCAWRVMYAFAVIRYLRVRFLVRDVAGGLGGSR